MKKSIVLLIISLLAAVASVKAQPAPLANCVYTADDSVCIASFLHDASRQPRTTNFPLFFARKFMGLPYVAHTLEVGRGPEQLVVNTRQLDCTTLVENVTALTLCAYRQRYHFRDFVAALMSIRYRDGRLDGYPSRMHYFTEWIADNQRRRLVSELQQPTVLFTARQTVRVGYMSSHPLSYRALTQHPEFVPAIRAMEDSLSGRTYRYIPKTSLYNNNSQWLRQTVRDGDIIAIVTNSPGLDIIHVGFACWHADGLHLLHASSTHKRVVDEPKPIGSYMHTKSKQRGIRVVRILK